MAEVKIRFLRDHRVDAVDGDTFRKGQTFVCNEASARHFLSRSLAELASDDDPAPPKPKAKPRRKAKA
jgi:hypothetical protein